MFSRHNNVVSDRNSEWLRLPILDFHKMKLRNTPIWIGIVHEVLSLAGKPLTVITDVRWEVSYCFRDVDPDILPL